MATIRLVSLYTLFLTCCFIQQALTHRGHSWRRQTAYGGRPSRNRDGTIKMCDADNQCGRGEYCVDSCLVPGLKECNRGGQGYLCDRNRWDKPKAPRGGQNVVVPLMVGDMQVVSQNPFGINFTASITLVRTPKEKNILIDTGVIPQKIPLISGLARLGLVTPDIDYVMTTHGHPDHYSNINLFPDAAQNFNQFAIAGYNYQGNALFASQRLFVLGDESLEMIMTPGHTPQDTTLIVTNAARYGSVGVVGDLFLNEDDAKDPSKYTEEQRDSMKTVVCQVDWIIPGHGPAFETGPYKTAFGC